MLKAHEDAKATSSPQRAGKQAGAGGQQVV